MAVSLPLEYRYTRDHVWLHYYDGVVTLGLTEFGLKQLGDLAYFDPLPIDSHLDAGEMCASMEGEHGQRTLLCPADGELIAFNEEISNTPEMAAEDPYIGGWLLKIRVTDADLESQLSSGDYVTFLKQFGDAD